MRHTGKSVAEFVADFYGLTMEDLCGEIRTRDIARPRQVAMFLMRELCPHLSLPAIGRLLGGRDHTTVLWGVRRIEALQKDEAIGACLKASRKDFPRPSAFTDAFQALEWARDLQVAA